LHVPLKQQPPLHPFWQQGCPAAPQATHLPPEQTCPGAVQRLPEQQACPEAPQVPHAPELQAEPLEQVTPLPRQTPLSQQPPEAQVLAAQQGCPLPPQASQIPLQISEAELHVPSQHG
jgi:hypothetical protein